MNRGPGVRGIDDAAARLIRRDPLGQEVGHAGIYGVAPSTQVAADVPLGRVRGAA